MLTRSPAHSWTRSTSPAGGCFGPISDSNVLQKAGGGSCATGMKIDAGAEQKKTHTDIHILWLGELGKNPETKLETLRMELKVNALAL